MITVQSSRDSLQLRVVQSAPQLTVRSKNIHVQAREQNVTVTSRSESPITLTRAEERVEVKRYTSTPRLQVVDNATLAERAQEAANAAADSMQQAQQWASAPRGEVLGTGSDGRDLYSAYHYAREMEELLIELDPPSRDELEGGYVSIGEAAQDVISYDAPEEGEGLSLGQNRMGYYNGGFWQTYMDRHGGFYLIGDSTEHGLVWNGSELVIGGRITVLGGNAATDDDLEDAKDEATEDAINYADENKVGIGEAAHDVISYNAPEEGAGLSLGANRMGYYDGGIWRTYMDNTGGFYLEGTEAHGLVWNGSTLTIAGEINVISGNVYTKTETEDIADAAEEGAKAYGDGRFLTPEEAADAVTSRAAAPEGSGLFLGSDYLGFYQDGTWRTYMDNLGGFYLTGSGGNALTWDGVALQITGAINVTGGNAATDDDVQEATGEALTQAQQYTDQEIEGLEFEGATAEEILDEIDDLYVSIGEAAADVIGSNASPSGSGLFLGGDFMGFYQDGIWYTYMDNTGGFYLGGDETEDGVHGLVWDGTTLTIQGQIDVLGGNAATLDDLNDFFDEEDLDDYLDGSDYVQAPDVAAEAVNYPAPAEGDGLFIGGDNLGFYADGQWKTYMDNQGGFFLDGPGQHGMSWDGTTLNIAGEINVISGNAATIEYVDTTLEDYVKDDEIDGTFVGIGAAALDVISHAPPTADEPGLSLGNTRMGFYGVDADQNPVWRTYMDDSGGFYLEGDDAHGLVWNGDTLTVAGEINVISGNAATKDELIDEDDVDGLIDDRNYVSGPNIPAETVSHPAPASGAGLFIGSDKMGFYDEGTWKTYIDETGGFFLQGSGDNSLSWNGTSLTINGEINVLGGNAAKQDDIIDDYGELNNTPDFGDLAFLSEIDGTKITDESITTPLIAAGAVRAAQIDANNIFGQEIEVGGKLFSLDEDEDREVVRFGDNVAPDNAENILPTVDDLPDFPVTTGGPIFYVRAIGVNEIVLERSVVRISATVDISNLPVGGELSVLFADGMRQLGSRTVEFTELQNTIDFTGLFDYDGEGDADDPRNMAFRITLFEEHPDADITITNPSYDQWKPSYALSKDGLTVQYTDTQMGFITGLGSGGGGSGIASTGPFDTVDESASSLLRIIGNELTTRTVEIGDVDFTDQNLGTGADVTFESMNVNGIIDAEGIILPSI